MNQKELNEIRRRFKTERTCINKIYGCYVNCNKEIIALTEPSMAFLSSEETEMYLTLMKKAISGTLGKNLIDMEFSAKQVMESEQCRLLQKLNTSLLADEAARKAFFDAIIGSLNMDGRNYLILLASDTYDVPFKASSEEEIADASDQVFTYFVCSICPIKDESIILRYNSDSRDFHSCSTGNAVMPPELGFMYPMFNDRAADIYHALYYNKSVSEIHYEFIDAVFGIEPPMSAAEQNEAFNDALSDGLGAECSFDVVQAVHDQIRERICEHKDSKDPEVPEITADELEYILKNSGISDKTAEVFSEKCAEAFGDDAVLNPSNLIQASKFEIATPEIVIKVVPEKTYLVETKIMDGRKYIMIPADNGVTVNGVPVTITGTG